MSVPNYNDIGKKIKDIFDKNFPAGFFKISANFPPVNDISLNVSGSQNIDSGKLLTSLDTKMNFNLLNQKFLLTEKWTTSNEIQSILEVSAIDNLKSTVELNFEPSSGRKSLKLKNNYSTEMINACGDIECRQLEPILTLSSMFKFIRSAPLHGGGLISFDTFKKTFTKFGYGIQYNGANTCVTGTLTNHNELLFQAYQKSVLGYNVDVGLEASWKHNSRTSRLAMAIKNDFSADTSLKVKIDNSGYLSFGYMFSPRDSIKLTFGAKFDCRNINGGGHKLGLQMEV